jgi:hypothetical protein
MTKIDRLLGVSTDIAQQNQQHYEIYSASKKWVAIGTLAVVAGMIADTVGVEVGDFIALSGTGVFFAGGTVATFESGILREVD